MTFYSLSAEETILIGKKIAEKLSAGDIIAMRGTLAAGKTTMTKGIAQALGIEEDVTSPTFTLISEYYGNMPLYHFDAYRLDSCDDFLNLGAEEMLYGDGICVIEWSEKVAGVLPKNTIVITIDLEPNDERLITVSNWQKEEIRYESHCN